MLSFRVLAAAVFSFSVVGVTRAQTSMNIPVTDDTFIDSGYSQYLSNGYDQSSYGLDPKVKVVSSATPSSQVVAPISYTHTLFQIPKSIQNMFSAGNVTKVTLFYSAFNDSLSNPNNPDGSPSSSFDGDDVLQLHSLAKSFTVGTGTQPAKGKQYGTLSPTGGADWNSPDGKLNSTNTTYTNAWSTPGGDYDSAYVNDDNFYTSTPLPAVGSYFSWNITSFFNLDSSQSDLETNGGLIRLPNEPVSQYQTDNQSQDFVSLNSAQASSLQPYFEVDFAAAPEPTSLLLVGLISPLMLCRRRSLSCENG